MDDNQTRYYAADLRRAGTLIRWFGLNNHQGVEAIIQETAEEQRITELLQAICVLYEALIDVLITEVGKVTIASELSLFSRQPEDNDVKRAATWICAHAAKDVDAMNAALIGAREPENRIGQLVMTVVSMFATLVPCVCTYVGLKKLENVVQRLIMREHGLDPDEPAA